MAARRVTKSAVDWVTFAKNIPEADKGFLRSFKGKSDAFVAKVDKYPDALPKIDWQYYKAQIKTLGLVDRFQQSYAAVNVPYPKDVGKMGEQLDGEEQSFKKALDNKYKVLNEHIAVSKEFLAAIDKYLPEANFTFDDFVEYFPDGNKMKPEEPLLYPGIAEEQPSQNPEFTNYGDGAVRKLL